MCPRARRAERDGGEGNVVPSRVAGRQGMGTSQIEPDFVSGGCSDLARFKIDVTFGPSPEDNDDDIHGFVLGPDRARITGNAANLPLGFFLSFTLPRTHTHTHTPTYRFSFFSALRFTATMRVTIVYTPGIVQTDNRIPANIVAKQHERPVLGV